MILLAISVKDRVSINRGLRFGIRADNGRFRVQATFRQRRTGRGKVDHPNALLEKRVLGNSYEKKKVFRKKIVTEEETTYLLPLAIIEEIDV